MGETIYLYKEANVLPPEAKLNQRFFLWLLVLLVACIGILRVECRTEKYMSVCCMLERVCK